MVGGTAPGMEELPAVTESSRQQGEGAPGFKTSGFVLEWGEMCCQQTEGAVSSQGWAVKEWKL